MAATGTVLKGKWVIGEKIGEGGCASVYEVTPLSSAGAVDTKIEWVAKVIPLPPAKKSNAKKRTPEEVNCNTLYGNASFVNAMSSTKQSSPCV